MGEDSGVYAMDIVVIIVSIALSIITRFIVVIFLTFHCRKLSKD